MDKIKEICQANMPKRGIEHTVKRKKMIIEKKIA